MFGLQEMLILLVWSAAILAATKLVLFAIFGDSDMRFVPEEDIWQHLEDF